MTTTNEPVFESKYIEAAAKQFLATTPEYIANPTNFTIIGQEAQALVDAGYDPRSVATYAEAFQIAKSKNLLVLNRTPPADYPVQTCLEYQSPEFFSALAVEDKERFGARLAKLTSREIDSLPEHLARFFVAYELRQKNKPPVLNEADKILKPLFLEKGFEDSPRNRAIISGWLGKRDLHSTTANLRNAIAACSDHLDLNEQAIELLSAEEYKKKVVDPAFKKQQTAKAKEPKQERRQSSGILLCLLVTRPIAEREHNGKQTTNTISGRFGL